MPHSKLKLSMAIGCLILAQASVAEIYISPVVHGGAVTSLPSSLVVIKEEPAAEAALEAPKNSPVVIKASELKDLIKLPEKEVVKKDVLSSGKGVPLRIAVDEALRQSGITYAEYDPDIMDKATSWKDAKDGKDILKQIEVNSGVYISINEESSRAGVALTKSMADSLSTPEFRVWKLVAGKTVRENLSNWGKEAGWTFDFSKTLVDYPVDHSAKLVGKFRGKGGVVDTILSSTSHRETPLIARFHGGNNVVVVVEAGYKPNEQRQSQLKD